MAKWCTFLVIGIGIILVSADGITQTSKTGRTPAWTEIFDIEECRLADRGQNKYFILQPGYEMILQGMEDGDTVILTITVLKETETVNGITTRVVEERESVNGNLIEVSRNFFAFCPDNGSVFYFGEDVDIYENGEIVGHEGAWRAGLDDAQAGLMMTGLALLGARYYQEMAPEVAMDRAEIISLNRTLETPAGDFDFCLVTEETSLLEPKAREQKIYAPGVGLIKDGDLVLVHYGFVEE